MTYPPKRPKAIPPKWTVHFVGGKRIVDWIQTADGEYAIARARKRLNGIWGSPRVEGVSTFDRNRP